MHCIKLAEIQWAVAKSRISKEYLKVTVSRPRLEKIKEKQIIKKCLKSSSCDLNWVTLKTIITLEFIRIFILVSPLALVSKSKPTHSSWKVNRIIKSLFTHKRRLANSFWPRIQKSLSKIHNQTIEKPKNIYLLNTFLETLRIKMGSKIDGV